IFVDRAAAGGYPAREIDAERATLLQASGHHQSALDLRLRLVRDEPGIHTLGALASLLAEMGEWSASDSYYVAALETDTGVSPFACSQLLYEWAVCALRRGDLERAEEVLADLNLILPQHVRGRALRAEVAIARGAAA
ncbi:MAG: hypothetical protein JOZ81_21595, partial [Chloroflexi bacterium]|nr:hypothetical protein [Chloroflexota bacterium]